MTRTYNWRWVSAGIFTLVIGTAAFYYGATMTFLVPGTPGESFFQKDRVIFGILPLLAALAILSLAGWLFLRSVKGSAVSKSTTLPTMIAYCILGAIGALWLCFIAVAIINHQ